MDDNQTFSPMSEKTLYRFLHAFYFRLPVQNRLLPAPQRITFKTYSQQQKPTNNIRTQGKDLIRHSSPITLTPPLSQSVMNFIFPLAFFFPLLHDFFKPLIKSAQKNKTHSKHKISSKTPHSLFHKTPLTSPNTAKYSIRKETA